MYTAYAWQLNRAYAWNIDEYNALHFFYTLLHLRVKEEHMPGSKNSSFRLGFHFGHPSTSTLGNFTRAVER